MYTQLFILFSISWLTLTNGGYIIVNVNNKSPIKVREEIDKYMAKEIELLENKEMRDNLVERLDVLDKVGSLLLLDELQMATTEQVAKYYGVEKNVIEKCVGNNKEEIESDGYGVKTKDYLLTENISVKTKRGGFNILDGNGEVIASGSNKGIALFPKRAILRVGMLLRDSEVAKELRTQLLNVVEVVAETNDELLVKEADKEKDLILNIVFAKNDTELAIAVNKHLQYVERYKHKAQRYDEVYEAEHLFTTTQIAKDMGMSAVRLNRELVKREIIYKKGNTYYFHAKYQHLVPEYADYHITEYGQTMKWKNKGREWVMDLLNK